MPPRYAYWTIIVGDQPTAFRSGSQEELMPTFKRLKAKNDTAVMMWFQNGKLWPSRIDAQEAMRARGEMGRRGDERQAGFRDRESAPARKRSVRDQGPAAPRARAADEKLDWKPKGEFVPAPKRSERPEWKPKGSVERERKPVTGPKPFRRPAYKPSGDDTRAARPEWKPKGSVDRQRESAWKPTTSRSEKPEWTPKERSGGFGGSRAAKPEWKPKGSADRERKSEWRPRASETPGRPDWKPRADRTDRPQWSPKSDPPGAKSADPQKRKWVPKEEYKKSMGIEARRDKNWRPGGEHKDPRQKYKDAKKAKWSRFKQNIRARSGGKGKKPS